MSAKNEKVRMFIIILLCVFFAFVGVGRLYTMQIRDGEEYLAKTERKILRSTTVKANRGEIFDRYGRPLVVNKKAFSLQIDKVSLGSNDLNELILQITNVLEEGGESFVDTLPITEAPFSFTFVEEEENADARRMERLKQKRKISPEATATDVIEALQKYYKVDEKYTPNEVRRIVSVRYEMENLDFSVNYPFTISEDVSIETVTKVKEKQHIFKGIEVTEEPVREYVQGETAAHLLGQIGRIYKEEYETLKEKGYQMNDLVGKSGVEKAFEEYLRGENGVRTVEQNILGKVVGVQASVEPKPGDNVMLTLDLNLQKTAEESLARNIKSIADKNWVRKTSGWDAQSGAAVVVDVKTGGVLVSASYPTFNPATFNRDYNQLYENPLNPMFNRAIAGRYEPGSTFKMLTAIAGLETGVIDEKTTVTCTGIYEYYAPSYRPKCWIYNDYGSSHGTLNVREALEKSCNIFFFETGRLVNIDRLNDYGKMFGLGQYTGIEVEGEAKGILAGRENSAKRGIRWYDGDTIQAAIGQSDNLLTPLQLANYVATIANGGTRYQLHLLDEVKNYTMEETIFRNTSMGESLDVSSKTIDIVIDGMKKVTEDGTASSVFRNYPISVAGKTGTAQVSSGSSNGVFVAFAPVEDPQIAIAIVIEHGAHGNWAAPIAVDIMDAYFAKNIEENSIVTPYTLLS